jgi:hypothetical protein
VTDPSIAELRADRDWWRDKYFETVQNCGNVIASLTEALFQLNDPGKK